MTPCTTCGEGFAGTRAWQRYCTPRCRDNAPDKRQRTNAFQARRREAINAIKLAQGCANCGYREHPAALDFNHFHDKKFNVSQDPKRAWSAIVAEIAKCEVLCANCHRIHTHEERHWHTNRRTAK